MQTRLEIAVLVSEGRHPVSGRPRRADHDARALEIALRLGGSIRLLHAGDPQAPALRDYLGMGVGSIEVLATAPGVDPAEPLARAVAERPCDLVLCGQRAEVGNGDGLVPYAVAAALEWPIVAGAADIACRAGGAEILLAPDGGRRRLARVMGPAVVTVGPKGPPPRLVAFARARDGIVNVRRCEARPPDMRSGGDRAQRPVEAVRRVLAPARRRLQAALVGGVAEKRGRLLIHPRPEEAAAEILAFLRARGFAERRE